MSDELRTLVTGTPEQVKIKDKNGVEHVLPPITLADFIEYEDKTGGSLFTGKEEPKLRDIAFILYLSLRREGLGAEDLRNRRFKVSEKDVYEMFDLAFLRNAAQHLADLLKASGFAKDKEETKN